jgi:hypothetical protein
LGGEGDLPAGFEESRQSSLSDNADIPRNSLSGNAVLLVTPAEEPQGGVLSVPSAQARSGGHDRAAGPMLSDAPMALALATNASKKSG